tara:strand:- start:624 stop:1205 length:582 start_codon:yes stop_codon:yes gene_type:complete
MPNIQLNKDVFNKNSYTKVIDTKFKELGVKTIQEQISDQPSVKEFFNMYNQLFFQINEVGPESHEYLVKTSGEYINFNAENDIVVLLQAEIAALREQLLDSQREVASFAVSIPNAPNITLPEIPEEPEPIIIPPVEIENTPQPQPPSPPATISPTQRVRNDFSKYPRSSKNKRAKRLNLSKDFIKKIKKQYNL